MFDLVVTGLVVLVTELAVRHGAGMVIDHLDQPPVLGVLAVTKVVGGGLTGVTARVGDWNGVAVGVGLPAVVEPQGVAVRVPLTRDDLA